MVAVGGAGRGTGHVGEEGEQAPDLRDLLLAAFFGVLAAVVHLPMLLRVAGGCDEWHVLQIGVNLRAGDLLYTDTNHIAGPGAFYAAAGLFSLFGESITVARVAMLCLFSTLVSVTWLLTRRLTGPMAASLAASLLIAFRLWTFPHFTIFHYATVALVLVITAFAILQAHLLPSRSRVIAAGLVAGCAFLTKQDSGALGGAGMFVALVAAHFIHRAARRPVPPLPATLSTFIIAAGTPFALAGLFFLAQGGAGAWLWQTIYDPIFLNQLMGSGAGPEAADYVDTPPLFPLDGPDPLLRRYLFSWMPGLFWDLHWRDVLEHPLYRDTHLLDLTLKILYRLPTLVLVIEAISILRALRRLGSMSVDVDALAARAAQFCFTTGLWFAFSKPRDWIHFSILLVPFFPLVTRQFVTFSRSLPGSLRPLLTIPAAGAALAFLFASYQLEREAEATYTAEVSGVRGSVLVRPEDAVAFQGLVDHLRTTPQDQPVLVVPCLPVLSFLADRPTLSRFIWLWPRDAYADRDEQIIAELEARPDASLLYVLMHTPFVPRPQVTIPRLYDYLAENYEFAEIHGPPDRLMCGIGARRSDDATSEAGSLVLYDDLDAWQARAVDGTRTSARAVAGLAQWPLSRDVLYIKPGKDEPREIARKLRVPWNARLRTRAGVHPDLWQSLGPFPLRLRIEVRGPRGSEVLATIDKDVFARPDERLWTPLDLDLSPWAGENVELVLSTEAIGWQPGQREMAGFAEPRIVSEEPPAGDPGRGPRARTRAARPAG